MKSVYFKYVVSFLVLLVWGVVTVGSENQEMKRIGQTPIPTFDISGDRSRQVVIAQGTPEVYQGHPASVLLPDGKTIYAAWTIGHGGKNGPMAKSTDEGKSWTRIDDQLPEEYAATFFEVPCMYRLVNRQGEDFIWVFGAQPRMPRMVSRDQGKSWEIQPALDIPCVLSFNSVIPENPGVQDGKYIGFYHHQISDDGIVQDREPLRKNFRLRVLMMKTEDAGFTWSDPEVVADVPGLNFCEPCAIWSPDNKEICCLMRENARTGRSYTTFSSDGGKTWSVPEKTAWEITGDRHVALYLPDGRIFIAMRDMAPDSVTHGHFIGWVGTYEDIRNRKPGDFRIKLLHSYADYVPDCGYPALSLLPNGDIFAITYIKNEPGPNQHSNVGIRFNVKEFDGR